jgi:ABC-type methionine transport system ATPase subunit
MIAKGLTLQAGSKKGRAIAKSHDVRLCDEPTAALDYDTGKIVLASIKRANEQLGYR